MTVESNDIVRCTASFNLSRTTIMQQVYHYLYTGSGDADDEVGSELNVNMVDIYENLEASLDDGVTGEEVDVWLWDTVAKQFDGIYSDAMVGITGEQAGVQLPNGAAALIRLLTNKPRRQGRKFISGISEEGYAETGWAALQLAALALAIADATAAVPTLNGTLTPGVFNTVTESFEPFRSAGIVNAFCGYQRRRRPGVGI